MARFCMQGGTRSCLRRRRRLQCRWRTGPRAHKTRDFVCRRCARQRRWNVSSLRDEIPVQGLQPVVADFNRDGNADFAFANYDGVMAVFLEKETALFAIL